jgi:hypothetical protein
MEDLKFSINRASFSTSSGVVTLQNTGIPDASLGQSPIIAIPATSKIKVRHLNHGMYAGSVNHVTLSGLTGTIALTGGGNYNLQYGTSVNNGLTSGSGKGVNATFSALAEVGIDHYIIDLSQAHQQQHAVPTATFSEAKVTGGTDGLASENYMMDTGKVVLQLMEIGGSDVTTKVRTTSGTSASGATGVLGGSETSFQLVAGSSAVEVSPNENINFVDPVMIASTINETSNTDLNGNKSFEVLATLSTGVENITPVIDTQRMGMICVQNRINNVNVDTDYYSSDTLSQSTVFSEGYSPKTAADGDVNAAIYVTRKISLANASTSLKVMFDAILFSSAYIDVYYKVLKSDDTTAFESITWTEMTIDKAVSESKDYGNFRERTYEVAGLDGFIAFAVKIVMRGTKSTEPPFIKDFRTIALAL